MIHAGIHPPESMPFLRPWTDAPSPELERNTLRHWWSTRAECSPQRWDLGFAVRHEGQLVGIQSIVASDFTTLRTAETGSWLGQAHHGKGIGTEMRRAVVQFAFTHLGANEITSSAFIDNIASQRVSLAAGYEPNGTAIKPRRGEPAEQVLFRLTRERWLRQPQPLAVTVSGFEPCRSLLGIADRPTQD